MQSVADYLESKGYRRGERKGFARGLAEGRAEASAEMLRKLVLRVLRTRFRKVPPSVVTKLAKADAATLEGWHLKALTSESVAAVFADS